MGMKKKAKTLEERMKESPDVPLEVLLDELYPVIEEGGGTVPTPPEPKKPLVPPKRISRRSVKDLRPVPLKAVQNSELNALIGLRQITSLMLREDPVLGMRLGQITKTLLQMHLLRNEIIDYEEYEYRLNASKPRKAVTKAQLEAYKAEFITKHKGKEQGWIKAALLEFDIRDSRTLHKIME